MVAMIINYQKQQLTTTGIYSLTVLEIRCLTRIYLPGQKSRCCLDWFLLEALRGENLFPCLYHLLEASYILWLVAPSFIFRSITPVSASVLVHLLLQSWLLLSPSLKDHSDDSGSTRIIQEPGSSRILPVESHPSGHRYEALGHQNVNIFGGHSSVYPEASLITQLVKNPPAMQETLVQFLGWKIRWRRDRLPTPVFLGFPCGSAGKESAYNAGNLGSILGLEDPLDKGKATHSSTLAWRIPCTV